MTISMALSITSRTITPGWTLKDVINDLMGTAIPALTHWGVGTDFGSGAGGIIQSADGDRELLFTLNGVSSTYDLFGYSPWGANATQTLINANHSSCVYNRKDRSGLDMALNMFHGDDGTHIAIVLFNNTTLVGAFENGDAISIATTGGPTTGTLVHWDYAGGMMMLTGVSGLPAVGSNWSGKAITAAAGSGATANTVTSNYTPATGWLCTPPNHAYITISTGVAPTAAQVVTGATSGATVIAGAGTPYVAATGKLTCTCTGNLVRGEALSWAGGTGIVNKHMPVWDIAATNNYGSMMDTGIVDSSSPVIIFEDAERLAILIPYDVDQYYMIFVGAWLADLYGGTNDLVLFALNEVGSVFNSSNTYSTNGLIMAYDGEVVRGMSNGLDVSNNSFRGAGGSVADPLNVSGDGHLGSYVGAQDHVGASWVVAGPLMMRAVPATLAGDDIDSLAFLGVGRSLALMNTGDPVKTVFSDAGGNRRWLKFDGYACIEFTDAVITP